MSTGREKKKAPAGGVPETIGHVIQNTITESFHHSFPKVELWLFETANYKDNETVGGNTRKTIPAMCLIETGADRFF